MNLVAPLVTPNKTGNICINVTMRRVHLTIVVIEKAMSVVYSEFVSVALFTWHSVHI